MFFRLIERPDFDSLTVCAKEFSNRDGTVGTGSRVDVRRREFASVFTKDEDLLVAYCTGGVLVTRLPVKRSAARRWERLVRAAENGVLTVGSLFTGGGTLDAALHAGIEQAGFVVRSLFANDNCAVAMEALLQDNPARPEQAFGIGIEQLIALQQSRPLESPDSLTFERMLQAAAGRPEIPASHRGG